MGASIVSRTHPWCDRATLIRWVDDVSSQSAHEDGHSYSGQWNMCPGLNIDEKQVFPSEEAALEYLDDKVQKWEALQAVPALMRITPSASQCMDDPRYKALYEEHTKAVTELNRHESGIVSRVRAGKGALKACAGCGSKISVKHLHTTKCPVCSENLLCTPTDDKRKAALKQKVETLNGKIAARKEALAKKGAKGQSLESKIWVVSGLCAS